MALSSLFIPNEEAMLKFGIFASKNLKPGDIVGLSGPLGAGKTTFTRGVVMGLGGEESLVHSPTFALHHQYECQTVSVNHCDFYRLAEGDELEDLGGAEFFSEFEIYLIEWPERVNMKKILTSKPFLRLNFRIDAGGRTVEFPKNWSILD